MHLKVDHKDIKDAKQELQARRRSKIQQTKKRKLEIQELAERIEERSKKLQTIDKRTKEFNMVNFEIIKMKEEQKELSKIQGKGRTGPTPVQFIYNYDKQNLSFQFNFYEYSENGNTVPF